MAIVRKRNTLLALLAVLTAAAIAAAILPSPQTAR